MNRRDDDFDNTEAEREVEDLYHLLDHVFGEEDSGASIRDTKASFGEHIFGIALAGGYIQNFGGRVFITPNGRWLWTGYQKRGAR